MKNAPVTQPMRQEAPDGRHDGRIDQSHLEFRGVVADRPKASNTRLGHYRLGREP